MTTRKAAHTKNWIRKDKRLAIYLRDGMACAYCGKGVEESGMALTLDHLLCRSKGGGNHEGNLLTCCHHCNCRRKTMDLGEWLEQEMDDAKAMTKWITKHTALDLRPFRIEAKKLIAERSPQAITKIGGE